MFGFWVNVAAIGLLAVLAGYVVFMIYRSARRAATANHAAETELGRLAGGIDRIVDERRHPRDHPEHWWSGYRKFEIARKIEDTEGVCSLYLAPHDRRPLPPYPPGQYLTFRLNIPNQAKPLVRCYSLSDSPSHPEYYRITVKRIGAPPKTPDAPPGQSSALLVDELHEGDILDARAPAGHFFLDMSDERPVVLIGGGIGVTPLISMLTAICESGSNREAWLFYGARNSREHIMADHLRQLAATHTNLRLRICYSRPLVSDVEGQDYDEAERVSLDMLQRMLPSRDYLFYVCGPPPMMKSIVTGLRDWGVSDEHIFYELFGPATVRNAKSQSAPATAVHRVEFARSGKKVTWDPAAESLLDFAEANGVAIESGCRAGNCGSCLTTIHSGEVNQIVESGADHEEGSCLACISVPRSDLVLDA